MAPEQTTVTTPANFASQTSSARSWVRIRFRKDGDLRLVSHLDLTQCFARLLRRAGLAYCITAGFHPHPRMHFALSLGLGLVGCREVVEIEFDGGVALADIQERLRAHAPAGLTILNVRRRPGNRKAQVCRASFRLAVPPGRLAELSARLSQVPATQQWLVQRTRPRPRSLDIRTFLGELRLHQGCLTFTLRVTPTGTLRPEEVLRWLGFDDLLAQGAILERMNLELQDEDLADLSIQEGLPESPAVQTFAQHPIAAVVAGPPSSDNNLKTASGSGAGSWLTNFKGL